MNPTSRTALATAVLLAMAAVAQAQTPPAPNGAASAPGTAASGPGARPPADAAAPKPFADVIKGAKEQPGLFPIWRKDEKVWIEIPKEAFNKPFLFSVNVANSIGERGLYASQMLGDELAEWRRVGNHIQLIAYEIATRRVVVISPDAFDVNYRAGVLWWSTGNDDGFIRHALDLRTVSEGSL